MISLDINIDKAMRDVDRGVKSISARIERDGKKALQETAYGIKDLVRTNLSKKKNAFNETLESEEQSTINRKGFSSPLIDTSRMQRGIVPRKVSDIEYSIEFTEKNFIYAKYLNVKKNWQVLKATDYIIKNALRLFKKYYGR
jgi:hypothetical protein